MASTFLIAVASVIKCAITIIGIGVSVDMHGHARTAIAGAGTDMGMATIGATMVNAVDAATRMAAIMVTMNKVVDAGAVTAKVGVDATIAAMFSAGTLDETIARQPLRPPTMAKLYRAAIGMKILVVVVGEMVKAGAAAKVAEAAEAAEASDSRSIQEIRARRPQFLQPRPEMKIPGVAAVGMAGMFSAGERAAMAVVRQ
jgi:hypothetical protein